MAADRTYLRCLCSDHDMPAVATLPYLYFTLFEYRSCLHIFKKGTVALLMVLLNLAYHTEFCCESMETFLIGGLRKILVPIAVSLPLRNTWTPAE